jgi:hypothetical protein
MKKVAIVFLSLLFGWTIVAFAGLGVKCWVQGTVNCDVPNKKKCADYACKKDADNRIYCPEPTGKIQVQPDYSQAVYETMIWVGPAESNDGYWATQGASQTMYYDDIDCIQVFQCKGGGGNCGLVGLDWMCQDEYTFGYEGYHEIEIPDGAYACPK